MNNTQRDISIDWLKGLAILLVVMGHELQWPTFHLDTNQLLANGNSGLVQQWISSFHMPLFFFLSGFLVGLQHLTSSDTWKAYGHNILRKAQTILLPGVTWMLVKHFVCGGWGMEWFLKVLFICLVALFTISFFVRRFQCPLSIELIIHILFFAAMMLFAHWQKGTPLYEHLSLRQLANNYPYVVLGYLFSSRHWNSLWLKHDWLYALSLLIFVVSYGLHYWNWYDTLAVYVLPFVIAASAILTLYVIGVRIIANTPPSGLFAGFNRAICYMGKHSLAIYVIHFYFLLGIPQVADFWVFLTEQSVTSVPAIGVQLVYGLIASSVVIAICLGLEFIIAQSKILNFVFFGKDIKPRTMSI